MIKARSILDGMFIDFFVYRLSCKHGVRWQFLFYLFCYGCDNKNRTLTNSPLLSNFDHIYDQRPKISHFRDLEKRSGYALFLLLVRARDSNPVIFQLPCGKKFLREFIFADWLFFCVLRELIFAIRTDWFILLGNNFCDFQKVLSPQLDNIFVLLSTCNTNTYFQTVLRYA